MSDATDLEYARRELAYECGAIDNSEAAWLKWCAKVEAICGFDLDGDQEAGGYSIDFALIEFERGVSASAYAASIKREAV